MRPSRAARSCRNSGRSSTFAMQSTCRSPLAPRITPILPPAKGVTCRAPSHHCAGTTALTGVARFAGEWTGGARDSGRVLGPACARRPLQSHLQRVRLRACVRGEATSARGPRRRRLGTAGRARARPLSPGCRRRFEISQRISTLNLKLDYAHETVEARRMQLQVVSLSPLLSASPCFHRPCQ